MTRLYVDIHCEKCGEPYAVDTGEYFGKRLGDEPIREGLCIWCEAEKMLEEKKGERDNA